MFRSIFNLSSLTLLSRILGVIRDSLIAKTLGVGAISDVWTAAFKLPNMFRRIFGEGAFNLSFVPMYGGILNDQGEKKADEFGRNIISLMGIILLIIFVLIFISIDPIVTLLNKGFISDKELAKGEKLNLAIYTSRITIGYLVFICLVSIVSAMLNSRRIFVPSAVAYLFLNVVFITTLIGVIPFTSSPLVTLSYSVLISGFIQLFIVVFFSIKNGINIKPCLPKFNSNVKQLFILMIPGILSSGVQQINLMVGQLVSSFENGGTTLIYFADRVNQLPLGIIGIALSTALLPELTRNLKSKNIKKSNDFILKSLEVAILFSIPASIAMIIIPDFIIDVIFRGGKFTVNKCVDASEVLLLFAIGTPSYVLSKVLQSVFFAEKNTRTPMTYAMLSAFINIIFIFPLFYFLGIKGCALATSLAGWSNSIMLYIKLKKEDKISFNKSFIVRNFKIILSAIIMGLSIWILSLFLRPIIINPNSYFMLRTSLLSTVVLSGVIIYALSIFLLKVYSKNEFKKFISDFKK